VQGTLKTRAVP